MIQLIVALAFVAVVLNAWGFITKRENNKKWLFLTVEILLTIVLIVGTIYANKG